MPEKLVIALGGNALQSKNALPTAEAQLEMVRRTCKSIAAIREAGHQLALVHGNGPQVGRILLALESAAAVVPPLPFDVCGAMSQGYIGYHLQQALREELERRGSAIPVQTLLTQVQVDREDPAFSAPSKPVGPFYEREEAERLAQEKGYTMREDAGRGWRRVVPSPRPQGIVELDTIKKLWESAIPIACGGGGIPVAETPSGGLEGVAAVIDKDLAACLLAKELGADTLLILTEVEKVAIRFGTPEQEDQDRLTLQEAERYCKTGEFGAGSMLPKVEAAMDFASSAPGRRAIIASLDRAVDALEGRSGTLFTGE